MQEKTWHRDKAALQGTQVMGHPLLQVYIGEQVPAHLQILGKSLIKFLVALLVLCQLGEELQTLFHNVFADHLEDLALLEHLTGDVQRQVLGVHNTPDKV